MGMLIGFFLLIYILVAIGVYKLTIRYSQQKWVQRFVLAILILVPTYDIILTNILGGYYCLATPSTYISKKVENPQSIYWEDNVYPGFNKEDRKLMIMNYLDGVHLNTMALNGDDGKIYTYETNASVWEPLKPLDKERGQSYYDMVNAIAQHIMETSEEIYTKETMPKTNYTVTFDEIQLNPLSRKFLYSDETKVIDNQTSKTIAYNRRIMRFFYNVFYPAGGNMFYDQHPLCGEGNFWFEYHVFKFNGAQTSNKHKIDLDKYLYNKYLKGEK